MPLLKLLFRGRTLFKSLRIGFTLLKSSFQALFFNHQRYFLFCIILTCIQFIHLKITGFIYHTLTIGRLITDLLAGENLFEIVWRDTQLYFTWHDLPQLILFFIIAYIQITLILFILCCVAYYVKQREKVHYHSLLQTFTAITQRWQSICSWSLLEIGMQGFCSALGIFGTILFFIWNIITIFDVQIISLSAFNLNDILKTSWHFFKKSFHNIVALDLIIQLCVAAIALILYTSLKEYIPALTLLERGQANNIFVFLILYLISCVMIFEVLVFTHLYQTIKNK